VDEVPRASALVQVVDVLRTEEVAAWELRFKLGQSDVRGVGIDFLPLRAPGGIEGPNAGGIAAPGIGRADILDSEASPQAVFGTEGGQAAFSADACTGEYEDAVGWGDGDGHDLEPWFVVRDSWVVVRDSWIVVRGSWFVKPGAQESEEVNE
jgi:hypothetical protein